jgi:hypothetical protein
MNAPRALHSKAIERACNLDRAWFACHPDRQFRLRDVMPFEFNARLEELPDGLTWRTLVVGYRTAPLRRLQLAMTNDPPCEAYSEDDLAEIFQTCAPEQLRALPDFLKRETARAGEREKVS